MPVIAPQRYVRQRSSAVLFSQYPWPGPSENDVVDMLLARVGELVESEGRLLPGAERALDLTGERGPLALASSTPMALIIRCLTHFGLIDRSSPFTQRVRNLMANPIRASS